MPAYHKKKKINKIATNSLPSDVANNTEQSCCQFKKLDDSISTILLVKGKRSTVYLEVILKLIYTSRGFEELGMD